MLVRLVLFLREVDEEVSGMSPAALGRAFAPCIMRMREGDVAGAGAERGSGKEEVRPAPLGLPETATPRCQAIIG